MKKEDKILIIIPSLTLGGAEKQALEYAKSLKRLGLTPLVLGMGREGEMVSQLIDSNIEYKTYSFADFFNSNKFKQLLFLLQFTFFVRSLKCKTGISFTYWPNVIFKLIARFVGIKAMYWNQRSVDDKLQPIFWERLSKKNKVNYIANSCASAESISRRHSISQNEIQVIYNVMDFSALEVTRKEKSTIDIIMVANFFEEKDHFTLIKAFQKLVSQHSSLGLKLHLVGTAPGGSKRLIEVKAMAFDFGLCGKVVFHGVVSDVKYLLQQMDIGVLSTYSEGFSNAIMEYMEAGLPVVASDIAANIEAVGIDGETNLFEVENDLELLGRLESLVVNESLRSNLGLKNRLDVRNRFNPNNLDLRLKKVFKNEN